MARTTSVSTTYHKAWDCANCGREGFSAYDCKQCPNCGNPLDIEEPYRTRTKVENYQFKGRDCQCEYCDTVNKKRFSCINCGAALSEEDEERVKGFTYKQESDGQRVDNRKAVRQKMSDQPVNPRLPADTNNPYALFIWGSLVVLVAGIIGGTIWYQANKVIPVTMTASKAYWSYQLALENFDPRQKTMTVEDGSLRKPPNDAYNKSSNRVLIRTEDITKTVKTIKTVRGQRR